ncbi:MAG: methyltransferase domain-containing protein [Sphingobacteriales bacterium]|nr:MAG: methyltransferase domain-containing protein [Sphingobacteriales bacterium]
MSRPATSIFRFKQFNVDQDGCAMKINTDGVLLGALAAAEQPKTILDIGTGTGVIALMLAQRFNYAKIDAVEIDTTAADTARRNFAGSPFNDRLTSHAVGFKEFFEADPNKKYDLIVSNPPFYIDSLVSPVERKNIAKHADVDFFSDLINSVVWNLNKQGSCWLILPVNTAGLVKSITAQNNLYLQKSIAIHSFKTDEPHREILCFGLEQNELIKNKLVIYDEPQVYSSDYRSALKNFLTIF